MIRGIILNDYMLAFFLYIDHSVFWVINSLHSRGLDGFFLIATNLGNGWVVAPILIIIAFIKVPRQKRTGFILFWTFFMVASGVLNTQIKQAVDRPRPLIFFGREKAAQPPLHPALHIIGEPLSWDSFPSGHSNTAFAAASLLAFNFGRAFWPAYILAGIVGYSRMYMGVHFPSDVLGGALLGIGMMYIGFLLYKWYERKVSKNDKQ